MNQPCPPSWIIRFLTWFCPDELLEGILGDVMEEYEMDLENLGNKRATWRFILNILKFFHPAIIFRNQFHIPFIRTDMLKSHLLVAFRSMKKYKFYAAINILGLALAMGFVCLSFLFIQHEWSIDQFHSQKENVYRIYHKISKLESGEVTNLSAVTAIPLGKDLAEEVAGIKAYTRYGSSSGTVQKDNEAFEELITYVDPAFLTMFDFPMIGGERTQALDQYSSAVISKEKAEKYFGEANPIGQTLTLSMNDTTISVNITGVIDAMLEQSSLQFGILLPFEQFKLVIPPSFFTSYNYGLVENYIQAGADQDETNLASSMTAAIQKTSEGGETETILGLQALADIHLENEIIGNASYTSPQKLYTMIILTLLVMLIAAINFITLSTSHGLNRLKEMGMRKTLGALKGSLKRQLILEAISITLLAGSIGIGLAYLSYPTFADLVESGMPFRFNILGITFILGTILMIGMIAGFFQAMVLVKYHVIEALKGHVFHGNYSSWFNQGLTVVQFTLSVLLIIGAVNIHKQMQFVKNKDLGFDKERLIEITMGSSADKDAANALLERFRIASLTNNRISSVSASMNNARDPWTELAFQQVDGTVENIFYNQIDPSYLETMDIEVVQGISFPEQVGEKFNGILVNEALVKHFAWDKPLEEQIPGSNFTESHRIIGVIKDFHFSSLHQKIAPLILAVSDEGSVASGVTGLSTYVWPPNLYQLQVRFSPGEIEPVVKHLEAVWNEVNPQAAFTYHFVDEVLDTQYAEEKRWAKIINLGSLFAICIAWFGLLGLMRLSMQKRTKEIGIRKVLGSSTSDIIFLLSKRFLIMVILGILIACPIGWILLDQWLQSFTYRIDLSILWFLFAGAGVLGITLISIALQSLKTANANPSEALKFE